MESLHRLTKLLPRSRFFETHTGHVPFVDGSVQNAVSIADAGTNPARKEFEHLVPAPIPTTSRPSASPHCPLNHSFEQR